MVSVCRCAERRILSETKLRAQKSPMKHRASCARASSMDSEGRQLTRQATKSANGRNMPNRHSMNRVSNKSGSVMCWRAWLRPTSITHIGSKGHKIQKLAPINRQILDPPLLDDLAQSRACRLNYAGLQVDCYCLLCACDLQC